MGVGFGGVLCWFIALLVARWICGFAKGCLSAGVCGFELGVLSWVWL